MSYLLSFMRFLNPNYTKTHLYLVALILLSIVGLIVYQVNSGPTKEEVKYYKGTVTHASGDVVVLMSRLKGLLSRLAAITIWKSTRMD